MVWIWYLLTLSSYSKIFKIILKRKLEETRRLESYIYIYIYIYNIYVTAGYT